MRITVSPTFHKWSVTSSIKSADLKTLATYKKSALAKYDENGELVFAVTYRQGENSVAPFGISFGETDGDGNAVVVGDLPANVQPDGAAAYVADLVGCAMAGLAEFEASIPGEAATVNANRQALIDSVTVL